MQQLYDAHDLAEARLVMDLLDEAGIPAVVRNEHLVGAFGELPYSQSRPQIWVKNRIQWAAARALVTEYEARRAAPDVPDKACGACGEDNPGNFELCWSCRADI